MNKKKTYKTAKKVGKAAALAAVTIGAAAAASHVANKKLNDRQEGFVEHAKGKKAAADIDYANKMDDRKKRMDAKSKALGRKIVEPVPKKTSTVSPKHVAYEKGRTKSLHKHSKLSV